MRKPDLDKPVTMMLVLGALVMLGWFVIVGGLIAGSMLLINACVKELL